VKRALLAEERAQWEQDVAQIGQVFQGVANG
jgi:hypothetical protein